METIAPRADLADPAVLASLGRIELVARWIVDGFVAGLHRSPRKGFSVEFADYRPYQPGDDLRYLDWKIAARADRWVVRQFEEETNLRALFVLDVSRSMDWSGSGERLTKLAYAERLVAALSLLFLRQRDAVGLLRFDESVRTTVQPRARSGQWRRLVTALSEPGGGRSSSVGDALGHAGRLLRRPGMVILVSDLLVDVPEVERGVRALRAAGHDAIILHLMDPAERTLPSSGEALFVDPESGMEVPAAPGEVRAAYRATVERALDEWRAALTSSGAGFATFDTTEPFGLPMRRAFSARERRGT